MTSTGTSSSTGRRQSADRARPMPEPLRGLGPLICETLGPRTQARGAGLRAAIRNRCETQVRQVCDANRSGQRRRRPGHRYCGPVRSQPQPRHKQIDELLVRHDSVTDPARSFSINDEANLDIYDPMFAAEQVAVFEHDLTRSQGITLDEWRTRPWTELALDHVAGLVASQL